MLYQEAVKKIVDPTFRNAMLAGCFGLAGTLVQIFISWSKDRDISSQRSRQLDEATRRVQFWDQWLKLSTAIGDPADDNARQRVQHELETLCQLLGGASAQLHAEQATLQNKTTAYDTKLHNMSFIRRLLLLYRPARIVAWIPRVFFYFFIAIALIGGLMPPHTVDDFYGAIGCLMIAAVFGYLSHWIEKPRKETAVPAAVLPSPQR